MALNTGKKIIFLLCVRSKVKFFSFKTSLNLAMKRLWNDHNPMTLKRISIESWT